MKLAERRRNGNDKFRTLNLCYGLKLKKLATRSFQHFCLPSASLAVRVFEVSRGGRLRSVVSLSFLIL